MNKGRRPLGLLLACLLAMQLFTVAAAVDLETESPFDVSWSLSRSNGTVTLTAQLYDADTAALATQAAITQYLPYLLVSTADQNGNPVQEYSRVTFAAATARVTLDQSGYYSVCVMDQSVGKFSAGAIGGSGYAPSRFNISPSSFTAVENPAPTTPVPTTPTTVEEAYTAGYRFLCDVQSTTNTITLTLSGLQAANSTEFAALLTQHQPRMTVSRYDAAGTATVEEAAFPASGGLSSQLSAELGSAAGLRVEVPNAVMYDAEGALTVGITVTLGNVPAVQPPVVQDPVEDPAEDPAETPAEEVEDISFTDVAEDAWYHEYVYFAALSGLVNGKEEGKFAPEENMTVAEAITLAARINMYFLDAEDPGALAEIAWYQPYVDYARAHSIPWEYADYNAYVTREEYVHLFYAAIPTDRYTAINTVADGAVPDVPMTHRYAGEIYAFYRAGLLTGGDEAGTFAPQNHIKRSEIAAVVCRVVDASYRQSLTL